MVDEGGFPAAEYAPLAVSEAEGMLRTLSAQEKNILQILFENAGPLTAQEVHDEYIVRIVNFLAFKYRMVSKQPRFLFGFEAMHGRGIVYDVLRTIERASENYPRSHAIEIAEELLLAHCRVSVTLSEVQEKLAFLVARGLVSEKKEGLFTSYTLNPKFFAYVLDKQIIIV